MPTTLDEAYDTLVDALQTAWDAATPAIVGTVAPAWLTFTDTAVKDIPKAPYGRFTMYPTIEGQATFRDGPNQPQRYESAGLVIVQCFGPRNLEEYPDGADVARKLATAAKLAYRGKTLGGCIMLSRCRVNRLDPEPNFYRFNMIAEYEYDEIG